MSEYISLDFSSYAVVFITLLGAYIIFGIAGFGTALVASPILSLYIPLGKIVPLLALMDMCAAFINVSREGKKANKQELKLLIPSMAFGSVLGAILLINAPPDTLLLGLGVFVSGYSLYVLSGLKPDKKFSSVAALPFGSIGGIFSALFGSGGFIYSIYLNGRLHDIESIRMTQTTLIGLSTFTRVVLFTLTGIYFDTTLLSLAITLAPAMLIGLILGRRITLKISHTLFIKLVTIMVLASGIMIIVRYFNFSH